MDSEQEQSDLGPHCLPFKRLKHFNRREKQTTIVVIGALRVKAKNNFYADEDEVTFV